MEDFLGLIIIAVLYLLSASSNKKKKAKRRQRKESLESLGRSLEAAVRAAEQRETVRRKQETPPAAAPSRAAMSDEKPVSRPESAVHEDCEKERLHLHQVSAAQMEQAGEGEDPCHMGGETSEERTADDDAYRIDELGGIGMSAPEVLRGVIMSEILTRPQRFKVMQKNRWRA